MRVAQVVETFAGHARNGDDGAPSASVPRSASAMRRKRGLAFGRRKQIDFRDDDDRLAHVEVAQDVEMLARLRHHAFVGRHHQQQHVHPSRAGQHVVQKPLVPGNVDDAGLQAVVEHESRESEIERHAAQALFDPAVRVGSGQRRDQADLP